MGKDPEAFKKFVLPQILFTFGLLEYKFEIENALASGNQRIETVKAWEMIISRVPLHGRPTASGREVCGTIDDSREIEDGPF
jgi:hypothetical protein